MVVGSAHLPPLGWQSAEAYDPADFEPIRASAWGGKPFGGLWTSPLFVVGGTAWTKWCIRNEYGDPSAPITLIIPDRSVRVTVINTHEDLLDVEAEYEGPQDVDSFLTPDSMWPRLDWEKLATDCDAVWLTEDGQHNTRFTRPGLYGWDCETVLWLQPSFTAKTPG